MEATRLSDSEIRNLHSNLELLLQLSRRCQQSKAGEDAGPESGSLSEASTEQTRSSACPAAPDDEAINYSNQHSLRDRHIGGVEPDEDGIPGRDTPVRDGDEPARQSPALGLNRKRKSNESTSTVNHKNAIKRCDRTPRYTRDAKHRYQTPSCQFHSRPTTLPTWNNS